MVSLRYHITYQQDSGLSPNHIAAIDRSIHAEWSEFVGKQTIDLAPENNDLGYDDPKIIKRMDEITFSSLASQWYKKVQDIFARATQAFALSGKRASISGDVFRLLRGCDL